MTTRQEIRSILSAEDVSRGLAPPVLRYDIPSVRENIEPGDPGPPMKVPNADAMVAETVGKSQASTASPAGFGEGQTDVKGAARSVLDAASGGIVNRTIDEVEGSGKRAAADVTAGTLESYTPEQLMQLYQQAHPEAAAGGQVVRVPAGWQPGTATQQTSTSQKDPNALRAAMDLQSREQAHGALALEREQEAEGAQYDRLQRVNQNEMRAIQVLKGESDKISARYEQERAASNDRLAAIQKAMTADPEAPRTIAQWLKKSGTEEKLTYGIAAALSALGGGISKDGGASSRNLISIVQGNIDRNVQGEKDKYEKLGVLSKMEEGTYARLREATGDDRIALNATKVMYYDAVMNATKQLALQYKWDMQGPAISRMMEHFMQEKQKLILDTAATVQEQSSQTNKYNPGGLVQVGGGAKAGYKSTDLEKDTQEFSKELEKRGFNMGERAIGLYQKALDKMREAGFKNDESFKKAFIVLSDPQASPALQASVLLALDKNERGALQDIVSANKEQLKDSAGKSVTANELTRDIIEKGGFSIDSLDQARRNLAANREQIFNATSGGFDPVIPRTYAARKDLNAVTNPRPGIGTDPRQAVDPRDLEHKVRGRLSK